MRHANSAEESTNELNVKLSINSQNGIQQDCLLKETLVETTTCTYKNDFVIYETSEP